MGASVQANHASDPLVDAAVKAARARPLCRLWTEMTKGADLFRCDVHLEHCRSIAGDAIDAIPVGSEDGATPAAPVG